VFSTEFQIGKLTWRKARRSLGNGECIEVAPFAGRVAVRDSKLPAGTVLLYSASEWRSFLAKTKGVTREV
jgi:Domain of unknown function (DUF397)